MKLVYEKWGMIFTALSGAVLSIVYISQYFFNMHPCHLCLLQRIPYFVALALGLVLLSVHKNGAKILLPLLAFTFALSFGLALFHFGVEQKWWTYASNCTATNIFQPGASVEQMMAALKEAPTIRCDQTIPFLFGISMSFYNIMASLGLCGLALYASRNALRR